ncbi:MAG TPA: hypothetical protein VK903_01355 [Propionicimonas sp.]|nr:hypothetical protein [Propionicimonas sp.]
MNPFRRETRWEKVAKPLRKAAGAKAARSGMTAGATVVALSVASAVTSAARRRQEGRR